MRGVRGPESRLRRAARGLRPLRSAWQLLRALGDAARDRPERNRRRVDREFAAPDPWDYATSAREQAGFRHQTAVLDRVRRDRALGDVLEVGCAEGFFTEVLATRCERLLAVDLSPAALERARRRRDWSGAVEFAQWDLRGDPLPGTFDMIVVAGVLEYFYRPSLLNRARDKLVGGLREGGLLFVVTTRSRPSEDAWWARLLPRGVQVNRLVARHPALRTVAAETADWYEIVVLERVR